MPDPRALRPGALPAGTPASPVEIRARRRSGATSTRGRRRPISWVDRLPWTDDEIRAYLTDPAVSLWLLTVDDARGRLFRAAAPRRRERRDRVLRSASRVPRARSRRLPAHRGRRPRLARRRPPRLAAHLHARSSVRAAELPCSADSRSSRRRTTLLPRDLKRRSDRDPTPSYNCAWTRRCGALAGPRGTRHA